MPYDDYSDQILLPHALSQLGPAIAWSDVNGDGFDDFYLGGGAGQSGELRFADGKGGFAAQWVDAFQADKAHEDMGTVFFDADGFHKCLIMLYNGKKKASQSQQKSIAFK